MGSSRPKSNGELRFHRVNAPTSKELKALVATISERVARYLERQGRPAREEDECGTSQRGRVGGFSLHGGGLPSGVAVNTRERKKLERICLHPEGHKGGPAVISLARRCPRHDRS